SGHAYIDCLDLESPLWMNRRRLARHIDDHRAQVDRRELEAEPGIRTREGEQAIDQPAHALALVGDVGGGRAPYGFRDRRPMSEQAGVAQDGRERCPQLMRSVGDKSPLRLKGVL